MKATQLLKDQHREVKDLFDRIHKTEDEEERRELLDQIADRLQMHMLIEESIFYPAVREVTNTGKTKEMIPEAYEEHHVVKLVLDELPDVEPDDESFTAKMTVLCELVDHHVEEEEREVFKAAETLGAERLDELGNEMESEMQQAVGEEEDDNDFDDDDEDLEYDETDEDDEDDEDQEMRPPRR
jgi:hemerythrin-like domain-containing protein